MAVCAAEKIVAHAFETTGDRDRSNNCVDGDEDVALVADERLVVYF